MANHQTLIRVLLLLGISVGTLQVSGFDCQRFNTDLQDDAAALKEVTSGLATSNAEFDLRYVKSTLTCLAA